MERIALYNDSMQNWKKYELPKAQLVLADLPYQLGVNAFASNPSWYEGGDNKNGESKISTVFPAQHLCFFFQDGHPACPVKHQLPPPSPCGLCGTGPHAQPKK